MIGHQPSHPWVPSLWTLYPSHQDPTVSCADLEGGGDPLSRENENVLNLHIKIIAHTCMPRTPPPADEEFHD